MTGSTPLRWTLMPVLAGTGLWFLARTISHDRTGTRPGVTDRVSHLGHALMALAMAVMIWPMG